MPAITVNGLPCPITRDLGWQGVYFAVAVRTPDGSEAVAIRLPLERDWRLRTEHDRLRVTMPGYDRGAE